MCKLEELLQLGADADFTNIQVAVIYLERHWKVVVPFLSSMNNCSRLKCRCFMQCDGFGLRHVKDCYIDDIDQVFPRSRCFSHPFQSFVNPTVMIVMKWMKPAEPWNILNLNNEGTTPLFHIYYVSSAQRAACEGMLSLDFIWDRPSLPSFKASIPFLYSS